MDADPPPGGPLALLARLRCAQVSATATTNLPSVTRPRSAALVDVAIAATALGGSLALLAHGGVPGVEAEAQLDPISGALAAVATAPLVAWRRAPFVVFAVAATAGALAAGLGYVLGIPLAATVALYLLATTRGGAQPWTSATGAVTVLLFLGYVGAATVARGSVPAGELLHVVLAWAVAWFAGERTHLRREHIAELEERARRGEHEAERDRDLAAAQERARIARDLHDSAGHAISVIAVRAGAARLRHGDEPERSLLALSEIEQIARDTVADIDAIVGALRDGAQAETTVEAPPGLASLGTLLERHASAGLDVTLGTRGPTRPLEGPVDLAAYRILQEALTNAARHGTGRADVEVAFGDHGLELTVANPVAGRTPVEASGGHGIVGMRERAALLHGRLQIGRDNGIFRLRAELPYRSSRA